MSRITNINNTFYNQKIDANYQNYQMLTRI